MVDALACDICVIGAGSGGLSVAAGASELVAVFSKNITFRFFKNIEILKDNSANVL